MSTIRPAFFELLMVGFDFTGPAFLDLRVVSIVHRASDFTVSLKIDSEWSTYDLVAYWRSGCGPQNRLKDIADSKFEELVEAWKVARFNPAALEHLEKIND